MTEPISDALFGVDGTELPPVASDPSGRAGWRDTSVLPSLPLPAMPDLNMTQEAIAAALGEDPDGPVDQNTAAAPAAPPSATPDGVPSASAPPANATAPLPAPQVAGPPTAGTPRPVITAAIAPVQSSRAGYGGRYRSPLGNGSLPRVHLRGSSRRFSRLGRGLPAQSRSNGGAGAFFVIMLITFAVLLYFIITGIVESFARLIP
jgi:hypothetical protein